MNNAKFLAGVCLVVIGSICAYFAGAKFPISDVDKSQGNELRSLSKLAEQKIEFDQRQDQARARLTAINAQADAINSEIAAVGKRDDKRVHEISALLKAKNDALLNTDVKSGEFKEVSESDSNAELDIETP